MKPEFDARNVKVIGLSVDHVDSHKKFCNKMGIKYVLLSDIEKEVSNAFGVWGMKKFMGREFMGLIRTTFIIGKEKFSKYTPKVKPAGHAKQVTRRFYKIKKRLETFW